MRRFAVIVATLATLLLAGCVGFSITPNDMRKTAKSSSFASHETVVISQPFQSVVNSISSRAPGCLRGRIKTSTTQGSAAYGYTTSTHYNTYTPSVVVRGQRAELHLQQLVEGTILLGENKDRLPKNGWYIMVVDITPQAGGTRIEFYRTMNLDIVVAAIKQWASNTGRGCPDLTKI